ncbi:hypothetical protein R5O24_05260 [Tenacibaculum maritimum]|uniref:hypothetical protein n=1 Tax=Tenacibaculum maritimum TaxID=107401 RepID=UPI0038908D46
MKNYMDLISIISDVFNILNHIVKFLKWTIENKQKTMKYGSLTIAILMSFNAVLLFGLSTIAFHIKAANSLQSAFFAFALCITFVIGSILFAKHHFKEYKNYNIIPK